MTFKLPRLNSTSAITDTVSGRALNYFTRLWDAAMTKIENQFIVSGQGIVVSDGTNTAIVRSLAAGTGLNITNASGVAGNPTYYLANTTVTPGTYGDATHVSQPTIDQQGRITACASVAITFPVTSVNTKTGAVVLSTTDVAEGSNQYFTSARARSSVSASGSLSYNSGTGVFSFTDAVTSVAGKTGAVSLATTDLSDVTGKTSWTPTISFAGSTTGITYTSQIGWYWKLGGLTFIFFDIVLSNKGSASGNVRLNLPLTVTNDNSNQALHVLYPNNMASLPGPIFAQPQAGQTYATVRDVVSTGTSGIDNTFFTNTTELAGLIVLF